MQWWICKLCVTQTSTHLEFAPVPIFVHLALLVCKHVALSKQGFVNNPQISHQGLHTSSDSIPACSLIGPYPIKLPLHCRILDPFVRLTQHPDDAVLGQSDALSCWKSASNASLKTSCERVVDNLVPDAPAHKSHKQDHSPKVAHNSHLQVFCEMSALRTKNNCSSQPGNGAPCHAYQRKQDVALLVEIAEVHAEDAGHNKYHCHDQVSSIKDHACLQDIVTVFRKRVEA